MPGPQPCRYHPFIFCIVGRGLDRLTVHNPAPPRGVGDAAPYSGNTETFPQPQTGTAA